MNTEVEALLLLGGNVGDPLMTLKAAELALAHAGTIVARSRDHWTEPWGFSDERLFLNRAVLLRTTLDPDDLLAECQSIERDLGRVRRQKERYASRTIDIDILLFGEDAFRSADLEVPHPRMQLRSFALAPAADIAPAARHPILGRTILQLLNDLRISRPAL